MALFNNDLAPLTFSIGFLKAPMDRIVHAYKWWQRKTLNRVKTEKFEAPLREALLRLPPLAIGSHRTLFVQTRSAWTAYFDNGAKGGDPFSTISYLAEHLKTEGVACSSTPELKRG